MMAGLVLTDIDDDVSGGCGSTDVDGFSDLPLSPSSSFYCKNSLFNLGSATPLARSRRTSLNLEPWYFDRKGQNNLDDYDDDEAAECKYNPFPQFAPGASSTSCQKVGNSIPLSIFPIAVDKLCICFCGLPGRGKTHIARRLGRYLSFFYAMPVQIFKLSDYRACCCPSDVSDSEFFDPSNKTILEIREKAYQMMYESIEVFLNSNAAAVAIVDSTSYNHTKRLELMQAVSYSMLRLNPSRSIVELFNCGNTLTYLQMKPTRAKVLWIEVSNHDKKLLDEFYQRVAATSPEYKSIADKSQAVRSTYTQQIDGRDVCCALICTSMCVFFLGI
jgi:hypothetical protein